MSVTWAACDNAATFWWIDQLSRWDAAQATAAHFEYVASRHGLSKRDLAALAAYAAIRRREDSADESDCIESMFFANAGGPQEGFACELLSGNVHAATAALGLSPEETRLILSLFRRLSHRMQFLDAATQVAPLAARLGDVARTEELGSFLARLSRAAGVGELAVTVKVDLIWSPVSSRTTLCRDRVCLPVSDKSLKHWDRDADIRTLGIVAHEVSHRVVSSMPQAERSRLARLILAKSGVIAMRHTNVIDEAIHTAVGNIAFVRGRAVLQDRLIYGYDVGADYPYAIDELARSLEGTVADWLRGSIRFSSLIDVAISEQIRLFGDRPRHHARVAFVYASSPALLKLFGGIFPALVRWEYTPAQIAEFLTASASEPHIPRWILLERGHQFPGATDRTLPRGSWFSRMPSDGRAGDDFVVSTQEGFDSVRRLLVAVHQAAACNSISL